MTHPLTERIWKANLLSRTVLNELIISYLTSRVEWLKKNFHNPGDIETAFELPSPSGEPEQDKLQQAREEHYKWAREVLADKPQKKPCYVHNKPQKEEICCCYETKDCCPIHGDKPQKKKPSQRIEEIFKKKMSGKRDNTLSTVDEVRTWSVIEYLDEQEDRRI